MHARRIATIALLGCAALLSAAGSARAADRPNIVFVMADDQGWGQTGYYKHPILKTPNLDAMAANGLRFDRFYAGAPVCSPTRASVLTGRCNARTGVLTHGYALHLQEKTISRALQGAGYATAHFGKWHLNGLRGPGAPVLGDDEYHPGRFGFDEWLTVTNFFDMNPIMSRMGKFVEFKGDSSEIIVDEALKFIARKAPGPEPFFVVIWYGTPHSPWVASDEDRQPFSGQQEKSKHHHGELVAMDRSLGSLRAGLRKLGVADDTLIWFNSDNGGLPGFGPATVGGLRGFKGSVYEGGLRVPGIIEWPARIKPRVTSYPAATMDIMPTLIDLVGLPKNTMLGLVDGISLKPLFSGEIGRRSKPIPFHYKNKAVLIDNEYKIITDKVSGGKYVLYNLVDDMKETRDLFNERPNVAGPLRRQLDEFAASVVRSQQGADYPEGRVTKEGPHYRFWFDTEPYKPYLAEWKDRPEFKRYLNRKNKTRKKKQK